MGQIAKGGALPRVTCPGELGNACGGRTVAAYPIAGAVGRGKVADHKVKAHDRELCIGAGQVVSLAGVSALQLTTDDAPRVSPGVSVATLPLWSDS